MLFGVLLAASEIVAPMHPEATFAGFADILGLPVFLMIGILWTVRGFCRACFQRPVVAGADQRHRDGWTGVSGGERPVLPDACGHVAGVRRHRGYGGGHHPHTAVASSSARPRSNAADGDVPRGPARHRQNTPPAPGHKLSSGRFFTTSPIDGSFDSRRAAAVFGELGVDETSIEQSGDAVAVLHRPRRSRPLPSPNSTGRLSSARRSGA